MAACSVYPPRWANASGVPAANILATRTSVAALCERRAVASAVLSGVKLVPRDTSARDGFAVASVPLQSYSVLQLRRVKRFALAKIACLVTPAEPASTLFGRAVRK
jgi:molybdopterin biosynthesis enzyme